MLSKVHNMKTSIVPIYVVMIICDLIKKEKKEYFCRFYIFNVIENI